jgi:hypothetical protein
LPLNTGRPVLQPNSCGPVYDAVGDQNMNRTILAVSTMLLIAGSAWATDRYYTDHKGQSPNQQYEAEAKSPANREGSRTTPFQKDFTIKFRDTKSGKVLWTWKQGEEDASPVELISTDDGHLIVLDAWNNYHVFDINGIKTHVFDVLQSLPEDEKEKFTDWTTAGVFWSQHSQQGFLTHEEKTYFYVRLYWGRTFILDISQAMLEKSAKVVERVEQHVVEQTRQLIKTFNGEYYSNCTSCGGKHLRSDLTDAVFVIKKHDSPEGRDILNEVRKKTDDGRNSDLKGYLDRLESKKNS